MTGQFLHLFFLFKSKFRRKFHLNIPVVLVILYTLVFIVQCDNKLSEKSGIVCINGELINGSCVCHDGWQGDNCQFCSGKVRLSDKSGIIIDGPGNYSIDVKCSWLIDASDTPNATIRLHFNSFATECGWDHLYIFDGDSVHAPLLGVFSGLMFDGDYSIHRVPEIVAHSGFALLHFYSDVAYNMSGFNISYSVNSCPSNKSDRPCSGQGVCIEGVCTCDAMFTGPACDTPICPNNCSYSNGVCKTEFHRCECMDKYKGDDCSQVSDRGYWQHVSLSNRDFLPEGSASHSASVWRDSMYVIGGEAWPRSTRGSQSVSTEDLPMIYVYDFNGGVWETAHMADVRTSPARRYGHSSVLYGDKIYMYGGLKHETNSETGLTVHEVCNELWAFDVSAKTWENITVKFEPPCSGPRANSTAICGPIKSAGHSATLVTSNNQIRMVVIFGHSPDYGYLNTVQEYYFGRREWTVVQTNGYPVKGGYGHSAAYDSLSQCIYVFGGFVSESSSGAALSNKFYKYNPDKKTWTLLMPSPHSRFLHSATLLGGIMLVFGGNTHNDSASSSGAKCYSRDLMAYDILCDDWFSASLASIQGDLARYGHSSVVFDGKLYVYGGFNGHMMNDLIEYTPGSCPSFKSMTSCLSVRPGIKCIWDLTSELCYDIHGYDYKLLTTDESSQYKKCPERPRSTVFTQTQLCSGLQDCVSCASTSFNCGWCPDSNQCILAVSTDQETYCKDGSRSLTRTDHCTSHLSDPLSRPSDPNQLVCSRYHSCQACMTSSACTWSYAGLCKSVVNNTDISEEPIICPPTCSQLTSCSNCTQEECIWCHNEERCIDKNAYTATYPYAQCREWTTQQGRCRTFPGKSACSFYKSCSECRDDPECGWCDDGSGTGLGVCMPGGNHGPYSNEMCISSSWYFTTCPPCQCNGHATCDPANSSLCLPCSNLTAGPHCEKCINGYYGSPLNGGKCHVCDCNEQGQKCNPETGKCFCTTKGIIGDHCERCDTANHYLGDPQHHGSCFYDLTIDYQFTFNLSKREDQYYTQINFRNIPPKHDVDADFTIHCSVPSKMNITIKTATSPEKSIVTGQNCTGTLFKTRFLKSEHKFGVEDNITLTTFYVYVYDFKAPLWISISFSQYPKLNLQQFFITFSSCFLLLLLVAAILWKIKQKYDLYRRRQRLFVEMEQMASRPFAQIVVEVENRSYPQTSSTKQSVVPPATSPGDPTGGAAVVATSPAEPGKPSSFILPVLSGQPPPPLPPKKRKKGSSSGGGGVGTGGSSSEAPSPIALEPCAGNRAAVLSLLIRLPTGGQPYTPSGQSAGLALASALVSLGNNATRKVSVVDSGMGKGQDGKCHGKLSRKSSQHPDQCV
uniref:Attractin-like protein 1 n=1 Tax=Cacopsylla melanoneura TaxID=428564 RepID=A0A8D8ZS86_9HEMI